jgi:hypothetical protein
MDIGETEKTYVIEPVEDPVPRVEPVPEETPAEPETLPV